MAFKRAAKIRPAHRDEPQCEASLERWGSGVCVYKLREMQSKALVSSVRDGKSLHLSTIDILTGILIVLLVLIYSHTPTFKLGTAFIALWSAAHEHIQR